MVNFRKMEIKVCLTTITIIIPLQKSRDGNSFSLKSQTYRVGNIRNFVVNKIFFQSRTLSQSIFTIFAWYASAITTPCCLNTPCPTTYHGSRYQYFTPPIMIRNSYKSVLRFYFYKMRFVQTTKHVDLKRIEMMDLFYYVWREEDIFLISIAYQTNANRRLDLTKSNSLFGQSNRLLLLLGKSNRLLAIVW